jgi:hypothetical protein
MSELSLLELDAQFSELLPEREALGCVNLKLPGHHFQPHHHGHHGGHGHHGHDGGENLAVCHPRADRDNRADGHHGGDGGDGFPGFG